MGPGNYGRPLEVPASSPPRLELDSSGPPMEDVRTEPDRDYPDDLDLLYERGNTGFVTRLTPADVVSVIAALTASMPTPGELVAAFLASALEKAREEGRPKDAHALTRVIALLEEK
jgi:hypothetical protein